MKFIASLLLILIAGLTLLGSVIIVYADSPNILRAGTPALTPTVQVVAPKQQVQVPSLPSHMVISQGTSTAAEIALTFDDGPNPTYTPQVLSILQHYGIHATFFCIGENVQNFPDLVQQENAAGNVVGNHTWSHPDLTTRSASFIHTQLNDTSTLIQQVTGVQPLFFRPPYGAINDTVKTEAWQLGLTPTLWSIDTEDWQKPGSSAIVTTALSQAQNGSIILMHDGGGDRSQTIAALPTIITGLQQRGFQFVTMQQLAEHMQQKSSTSASVIIAFPDFSTFPMSMAFRREMDLTHVEW